MSVEVTSFPLHEITNINFLQELNYMFYEVVGFKLQISFTCEGSQSENGNRRIFLKRNETLNKDGLTIKSEVH